MRRFALALPPLLLLALLVPAAPASAAERTIRDGADDVPSQTDMLAVEVDNGRRKVVLTVHYRGLRADRRANARIFVDPRPSDDTAYIAFAQRKGNGRQKAELQLSTDDEFGGTPVPCEGYRARWAVRRDTLRIVVPQRCLHPQGRVHRFKAVSGFWDGLHGDYTRFVEVTRG